MVGVAKIPAGLEGPRLRPGVEPGQVGCAGVAQVVAHRGPVGAGLGLGLRGGACWGRCPATEPAVIAITVAAAAMSLTWARGSPERMAHAALRRQRAGLWTSAGRQ